MPMRLDQYLKQNDLSLAEFARRCGVTTPTIMRVRNGTVVPHRSTMAAIFKASNGQVRAVDLVPDEETQMTKRHGERPDDR
jgi:transcriptional regulator with XRE-family HTH domain